MRLLHFVGPPTRLIGPIVWLSAVAVVASMAGDASPPASGPSDPVSGRFDDAGRIAIGDTLTVIQRPLLNIPAMVLAGDTLAIECDADPGTTGWAAALRRGDTSIPLTVSASSYDASTLWWTVSAVIPTVPVHDLYDLVVTADGGLTDTTDQAVKVLSEFKDDYYFIHITDTHLTTHLYHKEPGASTDTTEIVDLRAVISDINVIQPEFVLLTGDFVNEGELEDYRNRRYYTRAQRLLGEFDVPVYLIAGNHDIGGWSYTWPPDGTARRDWWRFFGWKRLGDPPAGAPWHTQNYSFDYGPVHFVALESYINYDDWRSEIYGDESFTSRQMQWLVDDLAAASGSTSQVLFYHYDFDHEIYLNWLGVEMSLWGHVHRDDGDISSQPYSVGTNNVSDEERSYRLVRVSNGELEPRPTLSAGAGGRNLTVDFEPANDGTHFFVTAEIRNDQPERFEHGRLEFVMPKGPGRADVTGGTLIQVDDTGEFSVLRVAVDIPAMSSKTVTVALDGVDAVDAAATGATVTDRAQDLKLGAGHPNPFESATELTWALPASGSVRLSVFDLHGRRVATLAKGEWPAGEHRAVWDGRDDRGDPLPTGVYFVRLVAGKNERTRKVVLAR